MVEAKIYGLCLERLRHQVENAKKKVDEGALSLQRRHLLESYHTAEVDDIIDILELYDVEHRTLHHVQEKLEELAYTVSLLLRESLTFGITEEGHLGLYLRIYDESLTMMDQEILTV